MAYYDRVFKRVCMKILHEGTVGYDKKLNLKYLRTDENVTWRNLFSVYNVFDLSKEFPCTTLFYDDPHNLAMHMLDSFVYPIWVESSHSEHYPLVRLNRCLNTYTSGDVTEDNVEKVFDFDKVLDYEGVPVNGVQDIVSGFTSNKVFIKKSDGLIKLVYSYKDNKVYWQMEYLDKILYDLKTAPLGVNIGISDTVWDMDNTSRNKDIHITFTVTRDNADAYPVLNMSLVHRKLDVLRQSNSTIMFYAFLMVMLAKACNYKVGKLTHLIDNAYILERDIPIVNELISRKEYKAPTLVIKGNPIKDFDVDDFVLEDYKHGNPIDERLDTITYK